VWNDSLHTKKDLPSGRTSIGGVESSQNSLENGG